MNIKTKFGNVKIVDEEFIDNNYLSYITTISDNHYGDVEIYKNSKGHKFALIVD